MALCEGKGQKAGHAGRRKGGQDYAAEAVSPISIGPPPRLAACPFLLA
jgi:hypothetical protein